MSEFTSSLSTSSGSIFMAARDLRIRSAATKSRFFSQTPIGSGRFSILPIT